MDYFFYKTFFCVPCLGFGCYLSLQPYLISVSLLYIDLLPIPTTQQDLSHLETFALAALLFLTEMFSIKLWVFPFPCFNLKATPSKRSSLITVLNETPPYPINFYFFHSTYNCMIFSLFIFCLSPVECKFNEGMWPQMSYDLWTLTR